MTSKFFHKTIAVLLILSAAGGLCPPLGAAKEDTARLVFRKRAPRVEGTNTYVYTVKKSEHLLDIVKNELGISRHRYSVIRRYNPHLKNLNLIHPGQKIILPLKLRKAVKMETREIVSDDSVDRKGTIASGKGLPPVGRLAVMQAILKRMNSSMMTSGRHIVPLPEIGQITIDCELIPVIEFDDGSVVMMDFKHQMPENIQRMVRRHWPNYAVVRADGQSGAMDILASAVNTSKTYRMKKALAPLSWGRNPAVSLPADWLITRSPSSPDAAFTQAVLVLKTSTGRIPEPIADYLGRNGLVVTEVTDEAAVLAPRPEPASQAAASAAAIPRLPSQSPKELVAALFERLGLEVETDRNVQIFDAVKDGFNLSVKTDIQARTGTKKFLFLSKELPKQFIQILREQGFEVAILPAGAASRRVIEQALMSLNLPFSTVPYAFPVSSHHDLDAVKVIFPTLRIPSEKRGPYYLVDFAMDPGIYSLLHTHMGFTIIQY